MTATAPPDNAVVADGTVLDLRMIPMEEMAPDAKDAQPRRTFDVEKIAELGKSLATRQTTPCKVRPLRADEAKDYPPVVKWVIVSGERRWRAATDAGVPQLRAEVVWNLAEGGVLEEQLIENLQRVDLTPMEEAVAIRRYAERTNLGTREVATRLGKSQMCVSLALGIDKMPAELVKKIERNERGDGIHGVEAHPLSWKHLRALLRLKDNPVELDRVYEDTIVERTTSREVEQAVEWALQTIENERKSAERATQKATAPRPGGGVADQPAPLSHLSKERQGEALEAARMTRARKDLIRGTVPEIVAQVAAIAKAIRLPKGLALSVASRVNGYDVSRSQSSYTRYSENLASLVVPELPGRWSKVKLGSPANAGRWAEDDEAGSQWLAFAYWLATQTKGMDADLDRQSRDVLKARDKGAAERAARAAKGASTRGMIQPARRARTGGQAIEDRAGIVCARDDCLKVFRVKQGHKGRPPKYCPDHRSR